MEELFQRLEFRIHKLLQKLEHLKVSNQYIREGEQLLTEEKKYLLTKHKGAVTQIENMIIRLKTLEGL